MLFLRALLFSLLLATSALAILVPTEDASPSLCHWVKGKLKLCQVLKKKDPNRVNGIWRTSTFALEPPHYKVIEITDGKYAQLLSHKIPQATNRKTDRDVKIGYLRKFFPGSKWVRVQNLEDYRSVMGNSTLEKIIPPFDEDHKNDKLKIRWLKRRETLIIKLSGNGAKNVDYGGIYVAVPKVQPPDVQPLKIQPPDIQPPKVQPPAIALKKSITL